MGKQDLNITKIENNTEKQFKKSNDFSYIPTKIRESIENMNKTIRASRFQIKERTFNITIVDETENKMSSTHYSNHIKRIFVWLFVASHFSSLKCSRILNVNLYFTSAQKFLPASSGETIDTEHANTAFTTSCRPEAEINIFREEEWFKVLIHETFHCMGLDFSEENHARSNEQILRIFPVKSDVRLFETYCETWAELLNVMFISYYSTKETENIQAQINKMLEKTKQMMRYEKMYSVFQCVKVLNHFKIKYKHLHEKKPESERIRQIRYKENTQILSYYVLKCILMFDLNAFIEWCVKHNRSLKFNTSSINIDNYGKLVESKYKEPEFLKAIENVEHWFKNNRQYKTKEMGTLRMSLFEQ